MRLARLTIDDFGLIAHAALTFADGLTVFSGETGSGKTMLLGALRFALGDRAEADMIRAGATRARVVLEIEPNAALRERIRLAGFPLADDDDVIVMRELPATGRSQARVNGMPASASQLREIGAAVVDIVGQHDAQRLLSASFAREMVDRFGAGAIAAVGSALRALHADVQTATNELDALRARTGDALARTDFARFAADEIDAATLEDGEDERLRERRDVLANAEKIAGSLAVAGAAFEDDNGAIDALGNAATALGHIARFGDAYAELAASVRALQSDATDLGGRLAREAERVEADPPELETLLARLERIERLKKKYGGSIAAIRARRAEFAALIERDDTRDDRIAELAERVAAADAGLHVRAAELTALRRAAAAELEARVAAELTALAMPAARFSVAFETLERIGPDGAERAEFRLAANPGEPERPVAKSASGGELSRVLLALIVAVADRRERTALVFDEIDAGIGGATAVAVGTRIGRLAGVGTQVIVVTHLAQIASWADAHYALRKRGERGTTVIDVEALGARQARLEEIARMLSGDASAVSLEHAATLVAGVRTR